MRSFGLLYTSFLLLFCLSLTQGKGYRRNPREVVVDHPSSAVEVGTDVLNCEGNIDFELFTGYIYSASDAFIGSNNPNLMLTDCIQSCRENFECKAINFVTGTCVLFKTSAGENTTALAPSRDPVFTLYAQKVCLPGTIPRCETPWAYETTRCIDILVGHVISKFDSPSRRDCAIACLSEDTFKCKTAAYSPRNGTCALTTMTGRLQYLRTEDDADVIEIACQKKDTLICDFEARPGRILKTVDAIYNDVESPDQCRKRCLDESFNCNSYDYMSSGKKLCRLSHHNTGTLTHIKEPFNDAENSTTYELSGCYQGEPRIKRSTEAAKTNGLLSSILEELQQPTDEYEGVAMTWAIELRKMEPKQQLFAKKAINEILFDGQQGTLPRDPVERNLLSHTSTRSSTTSVKPTTTEKYHNYYNKNAHKYIT